MNWLLLLLIVVPALEVTGFMMVSDWVGIWNTLFLILVTGIIGAVVARHEWKQVWEGAQQQMEMGQAPGRVMVEGLCIMLGGIMLLVPGFLSDIIGFTLVFPLTRPIYRNLLLKWIEKRMKDGKTITFRRF